MSAKLLLRKTSLVDYPGKVSTVLFFSGCNLRCPFCHNSQLVLGTAEGLIGIEEALAHIRKRRAVLGGVVLSGGEPCLWDGLPDLISEIKQIGSPREGGSLEVKLDTNGMFPEMLEVLISREETRPDYIAVDLKIAPSRYSELLPQGAVALALGDKLIQSAALIRSSGIAHEFRSLVLPLITESDIEALAPLAGDSPWHFRPFRGGNCLDPAWDSMEEPAAEALARSESLVMAARAMGKRGVMI